MASSTEAEPIDTPQIRADLRELRCNSCQKILLKATVDPVRASSMIQIKCQRCGSLNYLVGLSTP